MRAETHARERYLARSALELHVAVVNAAPPAVTPESRTQRTIGCMGGQLVIDLGRVISQPAMEGIA